MSGSLTALTEWDEQDVVARAKSRSKSAFDELVKHYERRVFRLAQNITRNHEDEASSRRLSKAMQFAKLQVTQRKNIASASQNICGTGMATECQVLQVGNGHWTETAGATSASPS
ncbi:MAG TPA: hypothetical protein VNO32_08585 [Candidatus Acidoferrum sp.]|nr:hypothetical protein [Candidatus Acidoferrum sp.]